MKASARDIFVLGILVALFLFMGAAIFHILESPSQSYQDRTSDQEIDQATLDNLHTNLSVNMTKGEFDNLVKKIYEFRGNLPARTANRFNWTYFGSLYFSASVITTIGRYAEIGFFFAIGLFFFTNYKPNKESPYICILIDVLCNPRHI